MEVKYGPYSSSRLDVADCPHRFKVQYIDKTVKDEGSVASKRGNVVHETFEAIIKGWLTKTPLGWDEVEQILIQKMSQYQLTDLQAQQDCIFSSRKFMSNPFHGMEHVVGTEEQLAVKWDGSKFVPCEFNDPKASYRGKVDVLIINDDNICTVIDHKTQLSVNDADTFQLGGYAWMVKICYPYIRQIFTKIHFCAPDFGFYSKPYEWTTEALGDLETHLKIRIGVIEGQTEFPARAGLHCQYCPIQGSCPELKEAQSKFTMLTKATSGPLITAEQAQKNAEVITVLEHNADKLKGGLKSFCKEIGPVAIAGMEYGHFKYESWEVPNSEMSRLYNYLLSIGKNPLAVMKFDIAELKKSFTSLTEDQLKEIQSFLLPKVTTKFLGRKLK